MSKNQHVTKEELEKMKNELNEKIDKNNVKQVSVIDNLKKDLVEIQMETFNNINNIS